MRSLSQRALELTPSSTVAMDTRTKALIDEGQDVVNFTVGEPDQPTPSHVCEEGIAAIREGFTRYTPTAGTVPLRKAIAAKLKRDHGLDYDPAQIVVSGGAKQSIFLALQTLCNPGDEVIFAAPYWVSYPEQVKLAGAVPVVVPTRVEDGFQLHAEEVRKRITPRTKVLLLNSPSNPTGAVTPPAEVEALAALAVEHDLFIISDEIYEKLLYDGAEHVSPAQFGPDAKERTLLINGMSKAYAMTGWRIGYTAAAVPIAKAMASMQSHASGSISSITQRAAVAALTGPQEPLEQMREEFAARRSLVLTRLHEMGVQVVAPEGAFYVFPDVRPFLGMSYEGERVATADDFSRILLDKHLVATVPGEGFGAPGFIRIAYACSTERIETGLGRLARFVGAMQPARL